MEQAPRETSQDRSYDPAAEVVELCQELIGIDTSNYGTDDGPGERKAAEHVAALLDEVGIESQVIEGRPGRANVVARWGGGDGRAPLLRGPLAWCPRGDLNPHALIRALAPQASASANSATRTSAGEQ